MLPPPAAPSEGGARARRARPRVRARRAARASPRRPRARAKPPLPLLARKVITAEPHVCELDLTDDDEFVVLACDGVWDVKSNQQVVDFVRARRRAPRGLGRPAAQWRPGASNGEDGRWRRRWPDGAPKRCCGLGAVLCCLCVPRLSEVRERASALSLSLSLALSPPRLVV